MAGSKKLITFLKHEARAFIFSAALPPPSAAAAKEAFDVIEDESWRVTKLQDNYGRFCAMLHEAGFDLLKSETAIVPVVCESTPRATLLSKYCRDRGIFVQAVPAPVVPEGSARLRACVSAVHSQEDIEFCANTIINGGRELGIIE